MQNYSGFSFGDFGKIKKMEKKKSVFLQTTIIPIVIKLFTDTLSTLPPWLLNHHWRIPHKSHFPPELPLQIVIYYPRVYSRLYKLP
jgi:hypothetical protein